MLHWYLYVSTHKISILLSILRNDLRTGILIATCDAFGNVTLVFEQKMSGPNVTQYILSTVPSCGLNTYQPRCFVCSQVEENLS